MKIQVQHLQVGDILMGFGETVTVAPSVGINTPKGKVELAVQKDNNYCRVVWGKYTMVNIVDRFGIDKNVKQLEIAVDRQIQIKQIE